METIPTHLIEKALALMGRTMEDMKFGFIGQYEVEWKFSIEKFGWYLLSPEFIEKYSNGIVTASFTKMYCEEMGKAIYEYQSGNSEPLVNLLSKITL